MAILYVAAEKDELQPFAERLTGVRKLKWPLDYAAEGVLEGRRVMLAANGAGPKLAASVVEVAIRAVMVAELSSSRLEAVVTTGYCGGLDSSLRVNDIFMAESIVDAADGSAHDCRLPAEAPGPHATGKLLSQDRIANTAAEKAQLRSSGAIAVDMEAAGVAKRAARAGLPCCCIKVVSDTADESFAFDLNQMRSREGRILRGKIVRGALWKPQLWPQLSRLKKRADAAANVLGEFLVSCRILPDADDVVAG